LQKITIFHIKKNQIMPRLGVVYNILAQLFHIFIETGKSEFVTYVTGIGVSALSISLLLGCDMLTGSMILGMSSAAKVCSVCCTKYVQVTTFTMFHSHWTRHGTSCVMAKFF
jgi:hypothetical protein